MTFYRLTFSGEDFWVTENSAGGDGQQAHHSIGTLAGDDEATSWDIVEGSDAASVDNLLGFHGQGVTDPNIHPSYRLNTDEQTSVVPGCYLNVKPHLPDLGMRSSTSKLAKSDKNKRYQLALDTTATMSLWNLNMRAIPLTTTMPSPAWSMPR
jgi:hypothetical protein